MTKHHILVQISNPKHHNILQNQIQAASRTGGYNLASYYKRTNTSKLMKIKENGFGLDHGCCLDMCMVSASATPLSAAVLLPVPTSFDEVEKATVEAPRRTRSYPTTITESRRSRHERKKALEEATPPCRRDIRAL
ncbi:hypothetical protein ACLOJK_030345 [Asimina triloba]